MTLTSRFDLRRVAGSVAIVVLVAACSSTGSAPASVTTVPSAAPSAAASASTNGGGRYGGGDGSDTTAPPASSASAPAAVGGEEAEVFIATTSIGKVLTGEDGMTLYTYKPDSNERSTCTGSCAENWPPFSIESSDVLEIGKDVPGKITTFVRADGTTQLAYDGAPLYYFGGDSAAGDTFGQGVDGVWSVAAP
jgi:predicted lipoprotein with Yx(FWY)xxD motif